MSGAAPTMNSYVSVVGALVATFLLMLFGLKFTTPSYMLHGTVDIEAQQVLPGATSKPSLLQSSLSPSRSPSFIPTTSTPSIRASKTPSTLTRISTDSLTATTTTTTCTTFKYFEVKNNISHLVFNTNTAYLRDRTAGTAVSDSVSIGRDGNQVVLSSKTNDLGETFLLIDLLTSIPKCKTGNCFFKYDLDGPAHYSGFLEAQPNLDMTDATNTSVGIVSMETTVRVFESGSYKAQVYLVNIGGLDAVGPLAMQYPEHPFSIAHPVTLVYSKVPQSYTFLGIMISDPEIALNVVISKLNTDKRSVALKEMKECSFLTNNLEGAVKIRPMDIQIVGKLPVTTNCRIVSTTPAEVIKALPCTGKKKLKVLLAGSSRIRKLAEDVVNATLPFNWRFHGWSTSHKLERDFGPSSDQNAPLVSFFYLVPEEVNNFRQMLKQDEMCEDKDTMYVFFFSYGIWDVAHGSMLRREKSQRKYLDDLILIIDQIMEIVEAHCPDKDQYRIIWGSNAAVQAISHASRPVPLAAESPEIWGWATDLPQAAPFLFALRNTYLKTAYKYGHAYIPYHEITLASRFDYQDFVHAKPGSASLVATTNILLTTLRQVFQNMNCTCMEA